MDALISFIENHKPFFDAAQALSSVFNLVGWTLGSILLFLAWRRNSIDSVSIGPIRFMMQEAAVDAAAAAARNWQAQIPGQRVDVAQIRKTIGKAFDPQTADNLAGKAILWVDDNPHNNMLAMRAFEKLGLDVEQTLNTQQGLAAMASRHFDLVISDMGRGTDMQAGYELLKAIRETGNTVPFLIFAGSDKPEFRREAAERGAQLSTNDMLELIDTVVKYLGS